MIKKDFFLKIDLSRWEEQQIIPQIRRIVTGCKANKETLFV